MHHFSYKEEQFLRGIPEEVKVATSRQFPGRAQPPVRAGKSSVLPPAAQASARTVLASPLQHQHPASLRLGSTSPLLNPRTGAFWKPQVSSEFQGMQQEPLLLGVGSKMKQEPWKRLVPFSALGASWAQAAALADGQSGGQTGQRHKLPSSLFKKEQTFRCSLRYTLLWPLRKCTCQSQVLLVPDPNSWPSPASTADRASPTRHFRETPQPGCRSPARGSCPWSRPLWRSSWNPVSTNGLRAAWSHRAGASESSFATRTRDPKQPLSLAHTAHPDPLCANGPPRAQGAPSLLRHLPSGLRSPVAKGWQTWMSPFHSPDRDSGSHWIGGSRRITQLSPNFGFTREGYC